MNTEIGLFRITSSSATASVRSNRQKLFIGGAPSYSAHIRSGSGTYTYYNPKYDYVISAVLTQEMNGGGSLDITVKKSALEYVDDVRNFIEVKCPYIMNTGHDSISNMQNYGCVWIGRQAKKSYKSDRISLTYEGELSWLEPRIIAPYSYTGTNIAFTGTIVSLFNRQTFYSETHSSPYQFTSTYTTSSHSICDIGPSVARSNIYYSTLWQELDEKILKRYNNQILVRQSSDSTNSSFKRNILTKPISDTDRGFIDENDIISASHSINLVDRHAGVYTFGEKNDPSAEGDNTRWHGFAQGISDYTNINYSTFKAYVIGDYTDTTTLNEKAALYSSKEISDTNYIDITLTLSKQESLNLGELYYIRDNATGIKGYYRLMKRSVDLLNPAKNRLTFGAYKSLSSTRG